VENEDEMVRDVQAWLRDNPPNPVKDGGDEDADDDGPKTWRELAEAAIGDLRGYADDELPYRRLVSAEAYETIAARMKEKRQ
jgi:hypothetical protein